MEARSTRNDQKSYDPDFFNPLFSAEDRHFWFRARNRLISLQAYSEIKNLAPGFQVLEVGCGTGNVLQFLERICINGQLTGMDLYSEGLYYARKRVKAGLVQADLHQPPFQKKFDLIGIFDVLEHIADDVQVLKDLYSLIKPGGALLLTVPAFQSLWSYFDVAALHIRRYRQKELNSKLQMAGFKIENTSYYMTSIFPLVWGGRKLASIISSSKNESKKSDQELTVNELRIVPVINQILTWILLNEVKLIHRGVRMPFGTSLMALARKSE